MAENDNLPLVLAVLGVGGAALWWFLGNKQQSDTVPPPEPTPVVNMVTITADKTSASVADMISITATAALDNNSPAAQKVLSWVVDDAVIDIDGTDDNGMTTFKSRFEPGSHTVQAVVEGVVSNTVNLTITIPQCEAFHHFDMGSLTCVPHDETYGNTVQNIGLTGGEFEIYYSGGRWRFGFRDSHKNAPKYPYYIIVYYISPQGEVKRYNRGTIYEKGDIINNAPETNFDSATDDEYGTWTCRVYGSLESPVNYISYKVPDDQKGRYPFPIQFLWERKFNVDEDHD